jgi:hypothetical protein
MKQVITRVSPSHLTATVLFCDGDQCNLPVHQKCYGVKVIPRGDWFCDKCSADKEEDSEPALIICCDEKEGPFKRIQVCPSISYAREHVTSLSTRFVQCGTKR